MDKKLKEIINLDFFDIPVKKLKNKLLAFKFRMNDLKLSSDKPEIFISNKTSTYDRTFITNCIENNFVFLKDDIIEKLYMNSLSKNEIRSLFLSINQIRDAGISLVIFPERHQTVFGEFSKIPTTLTDKIINFGYKKVNFINLIGTYFIKPIWLKKEQTCETKIECKFSINIDDNLSSDNFNLFFNKYMPSSASTYSSKIPIYTRGNSYAEGFESVFSICPNCKSFFTLKSEYCCIKCSKCIAAFEFSENYEISLTNEFSNLDGAKKFQKEILEKINIKNSPIVTYKKILCTTPTYTENQSYNATKLEIYQNMIAYLKDDLYVNIYYKDIIDSYLTYENTINIKYLEENQIQAIQLKGENNENLYIIIELINIFKENANK